MIGYTAASLEIVCVQVGHELVVEPCHLRHHPTERYDAQGEHQHSQQRSEVEGRKTVRHHSGVIASPSRLNSQEAGLPCIGYPAGSHRPRLLSSPLRVSEATVSSVGTPSEPVVIGWSEYIDIPDWNIEGLRAKMDTGARTSALHVENICEVSEGRVRFDVRLHRRRSDRRVTVEAPITRRSRVRSSSGRASLRYFVSARILIGPVQREIELSLVDRRRMIFRLLIGRAALDGSFLVDAGRRNVVTRRHPQSLPRRAPRLAP